MAAAMAPEHTVPPTETPVLDEKASAVTETVEPASSSKTSEQALEKQQIEAAIEPKANEEPTPAPAAVSVDAAPTASAASAAEPTTPSGPTKLPIAKPLPQCKPASQPELSAEQKTKYEEVLKGVQAWSEVPTTSAKNSPKEAITEDERMWLTRECLLRYLRATKWNVAQAQERLLSTLTWRREYGLAGFTPDYISPEQETGKQIILGFDHEGRPCLYMDPSKQNTKESERQLHHLVYWLETCIALLPPGQETLALVIDFKNTSKSKNPSISTGRKTMNILQGHYPERLGKALISDLPWYVSAFFKLISPLIDPVTKTKLVFSEPLSKYVPASQLQKPYGGELEFVYDHSVYWPAINTLSESRKREMKERWEKRGKKVGDDEWALRGGEDPSVAAVQAGTEKLAV